jgi:hypothetical protein
LIAFAVMALWLVGMVSVAQADTGDIIEPQHDPPTAADGWQAATCTKDTPKCSPNEPNFFVQAGGHPPIGFTQYTVQHEPFEPSGLPSPPFPPGTLKAPIKSPQEKRTIKTLRVDLPPGLTVNPQATPEKCTLAEFLHSPAPGEFEPECSEEKTKVGEEEVTLVTNGPNVEVPGVGVIPVEGFVVPPTPGVSKVPVFNLVPKEGEPALFGFVIGSKEPVFLETEVAWESDYHESFTIRLPNTAAAPGLATLISRLVNFGDKTGNGTYISNPTTCFDPKAFPHLYSTWFRAESYEEPDPAFPNGSTPVEAKVESSTGTLFQQSGCDEILFSPKIKINPGTTEVDSPSPAAVTTEVPFEIPKAGGDDQSQSHLRSAAVTLPAGMGLNPSGSNGLVACTDPEFKKNQRVEDNSCPASSKIGTAEIKTPPLTQPLRGDIYVGEQKSSNPASGEEFRILVEAKSKTDGVVVRLVGNTSADPLTGQLTTTFNDQEIGPLTHELLRGLPQAPFEAVTLRFDGPRLILTSPPTCSAADSSGQMEPWARPGEQVSVSDKFTLTSIPGGGTCPTTLAARPFAPSYTAKSDSIKANAYSPFRVHIGRKDGEQELKGVDVTLPKGLVGKLKGVTYCPESAMTAAAAASAASELASPSCPASSEIGTTSTESGTGANPLKLGGHAYLAGPYKGAPLSMVVITPAKSGPFDLGNVVVQVALFVEPETVQVHAVSDPIPDVFGGVKLDVRTIDVNVDRPKFMHNPTNCKAGAVSGVLNGGGSDPTTPSAFSSYPVSAAYQASECNKLGFKPKLHTRLSGGKGVTQRAKHPKLRAILETREKDANVLRTALTLPHAIFLDQSHIKTVCTRPQLASQTCPKKAIYGHAEAKSPLLDKKLKGPVYLVSSNHELPDLLVNLRGQINVQLRGVISSKNGGLKTVFNNVPDAAVSKFILRMEGGNKGLLVNSRNLCKGRLTSVLGMKGQNGKKANNKHLPLRVPCG